MINEGLKLKGILKFTFINVKTGKKRVSEYHNTITNACYEMIAKRLSGEGNDCNITYVAVGTGAFPGTPATSTTLVTELERIVVTAISYSTVTISVTGYFGAAAGIGILTECGLFGEAADGNPDTGTMINHAAITETKTASETMTIDFSIAPA